MDRQGSLIDLSGSLMDLPVSLMDLRGSLQLNVLQDLAPVAQEH